MKFLAMARAVPGVDRSQLGPLVHGEMRAVWRLHKEGIFRQIWTRQGTSLAVGLVEAENLAAVQVAFDELPMVAQGLLAFDVHPLEPFAGFEALFDPR